MGLATAKEVREKFDDDIAQIILDERRIAFWRFGVPLGGILGALILLLLITITMGRPGVSGLPDDLVTGSAVFTKEQEKNIKESADRGNGNKGHSLRTAIKTICLEYVNIHTVLEVEEVDEIKELGGSESLCESLAVIGKRALNGGK
jgi:hypothetical protein